MVADYIKRCPDWLRDELKPLLLDVDKDDLNKLLWYVKDQFSKNQSVMFALTGMQGVGKTLSMWYLSDLLGFDREVIYTRKQHLKLIENMPENKIILYPDIGLLFPSRKWKQSDIQSFANTIRVFRNLYMIAIPYIEDADISFRKVFLYDSEVKLIHDRRIVRLIDKENRFDIVIPVLDEQYVKQYHELDIKLKREALKADIKKK